MILKRYIPNRYLRLLAYLAVFFLLIYLMFHWLLNYRTKEIIEAIIEKETKGKVSVRIGNVKLKLLPETRLDLMDTRVQFMDSTGKNMAYQVEFTYLGLQLHSLKDFVLHKKMEVDFLVAENPHIQINPSYSKAKEQQGNKAVHFEIGNIYLALQKIASEMKVRRFGLLNGKITLLKMQPNETTISIGGVNFTARDLAMAPVGSGLVEEQLQAGRLRLNTGKQQISFPEGNYDISYSKLHLDTEEKLVTIEDFTFTGKAKDSSLGNIEAGFANFRMYDLDFWSLYKEGTIRIDSLVCTDPRIKMGLDITPGKNKAANPDISVEKKIATLTGKLDIGYIALRNSTFDITTRNGNKVMPFHSSGNDLEVIGIKADSSAPRPLEISKVAFAIKNYKAMTSDSLYNILFDSVVFANRSINLLNFRIQPSEKNKQKNLKWMEVPNFQLNDISISDLLSSKKLKARELVLANGRSRVLYLRKPEKTRRSRPLREVITSIHKSVDLEKVRIIKTSVEMQSATDPEQKALIYGLNSEISLEEMFDASTYEVMGYSVGKVSFDSFHIRKGRFNINMSDGEIRGKDKRITAKHVNINDPATGTRAHAKDLVIFNYHFDDEFNEISVDSIGLSYASFHIRPSPDRANRTSGTGNKRSPRLYIKHFRVRDIKLDYNAGDTIAVTATLPMAELKGLGRNNNKWSIDDATINANGIAFRLPGIDIATGGISIRNRKASRVQDLRANYLKNGDTVRANIASISFEPNISAFMADGSISANELSIMRPYIQASVHARPASAKSGEAKPLDLGRIHVEDGAFSLRSVNGNHSSFFSSNDVNVDINRLKQNTGDDVLLVEKASIRIGGLQGSLNDSIHVTIPDQPLFIGIGKFNRYKKDSNISTAAVIDSLEARALNLKMTNRKGKTMELDHFSVGVEDLVLDSLTMPHILRRIKQTPSLHGGGVDFVRSDSNGTISVRGIGFTNYNRTISADSFSYRPALDRDAFNRKQVWQKDYMEVSTGRISIQHFDLEKFASDSIFHVAMIGVTDPRISVYKDKRLPFQHGIIKPLPVDMLEKLNKKIQIDTVMLMNGHVTYEEMNDKTNSLGRVDITDLQARLRNVKTFGFTASDTLYLRANASFLDKAPLFLRFAESYSDTLGAFLMQVRLGHLDLTELNPVIGPLAAAKVEKGILDTLELKAIGREYIAFGKMKMLYRDLKIQFLNKEDQQKKTIVTRFMTWAANLVVQGKNTKKTGTVFTQRVRERSVFNYWIKMVLSGALTNAGIKKNSRQEKKYKKTLRKLNVPEIPEVEL